MLVALDRIRAWLACGLACLAAAPAWPGDDLLPPAQAFSFSARVVDAGNLEVRYRIADGYYMYREKFRFSAQSRTVALGRPSFPPGTLKDDEYFGRVETYRDEVVIHLPFSAERGVSEVTLDAVSQGCADVGVCYTPQKATARLHLAALDAPAVGNNRGGRGGVLAKLQGLAAGTDTEAEFLPPDEAFKVRVHALDAETIVADLEPAEGYYLYREKIQFAFPQEAGLSVVRVELPPGDRKDDPNFGVTEVFHRAVQAHIALARQPGASRQVTLEARYQGCADAGLCYPPEKKSFTLTLAAWTGQGPGASTVVRRAPAVGTAQPAPSGPGVALPRAQQSELASEVPQQPPIAAGQDESSRIAGILRSGNFWAIVASFFGFGVLLAFTPCVLPMVPILSGIIVGQGKRATRRYALLLTGAYVTGMAVTYAAAGVAAGLSGTLLSNLLQNPWVLVGFALLFVVLALSMFGFYELQLPSSLQSKLADASNRMRGGTFWGVFAMGVLSALIVGPCVAAPLAGALLYINQTRDAVLGGSALFAMALGMGVPLVAVGLSAGSLLPRAGAWMHTVKGFFGVLLLALAIWIVSPVIPPVVGMLLWAALLICSAVYLHAIDPLPHNAPGYRKLWKGVGVIALLSGVALLIGALSGGRDVLQPLAGWRAGMAAGEPSGPRFVRVASVGDLEAKLAQAGRRAVMLDFYADWCVSCKEMERFTFSDPQVRERMSRMLLLKADVTQNSPEDAELLRKFGLFGPPGTIFFGANGVELTGTRVIGFLPPDRFGATLDAVLART